MEDLNNWFINGQMRLNPAKPGTPIENENGILFTADYLYGKTLNSEVGSGDAKLAMEAVTWFYQKGYFDKNPGSHDNETALRALCRFAGVERKGLPEFETHFLHPRDWVLYGIEDGKWWLFLFYPIPVIACIYSCLKLTQTRPKLHQRFQAWREGRKLEIRKELRLSGKFLWIIRTHFGPSWMRPLNWVTHKCLRFRVGRDYHSFLAKEYFENPSHPVRRVFTRAFLDIPVLD